MSFGSNLEITEVDWDETERERLVRALLQKSSLKKMMKA
jgi:hypothetical protein